MKNPNPRPERVAYIQLPEAVACIIFTSKNLISYNNYIEKLDEVIGSVKYRPDLIGKWMEYTSSDASFSVFMPATPVETVKQVNTPAGAIDVHIFSFEYKDLVYIVSYSDYPEEVVKSRSIADMLDNGRNGVVSNVQGKLLSELIVSLNEFPGRELRIETPDGKGTIVSRIFLVRNRFYQVAAATYKENSFSPAIPKYLDSFRLLEKRAER